MKSIWLRWGAAPSLSDGDFSRVTVRDGSGVTFECAEPSTARQICGALAGENPYQVSLTCQGHTWSVANCSGYGNDLGVDISACGCNYGGLTTTVRPCGGQWSGVQAPGCYYPVYPSLPTQAIEVVCDYGSATPGRCGDGIINQASAQCDGSALPAGAPPGSTCNMACQLATPSECVRANCPAQREVVDQNIAVTDPILNCLLGTNWRDMERVAAGNCTNSDPLTCYCGNLSGSDCVSAAPSQLAGQCTAELLAGTGCTNSACAAPIFYNPANATGKAIQFVQCEQDFCYEQCFTPPPF